MVFCADPDLVGVFDEVEVGEESAEVGHQRRVGVANGASILAKVVGDAHQLLQLQELWRLHRLLSPEEEARLTISTTQQQHSSQGGVIGRRCRYPLGLQESRNRSRGEGGEDLLDGVKVVERSAALRRTDDVRLWTFDIGGKRPRMYVPEQS